MSRQSLVHRNNNNQLYKMNGHLVIALAVGAAVVALTDSTILLAGTGVTVSGGPGSRRRSCGRPGCGAAAVALARRGKREVASCLPFGNPELYFSMAANSDFLDCGRRFVCELEATADGNLSEEEILIRNFFGRRNSAVNGLPELSSLRPAASVPSTASLPVPYLHLSL
ncbi:uncharacterized protein LOC121858443 [Homarus americanus]|nr:uncharacterized protein LOC121858443 [Homarus americanus]